MIALALSFLGCGGAGPQAATAPKLGGTGTDDSAPTETAAERALAPAQPVASSDIIPVDPGDPVWGDALAPVTLVMFTDFQCPFCARAHATVEELKRKYGPAELRIVFKHNPLPFHDDAMPAAVAAQAVYELRGPVAFDAYAARLFDGQRALTDANLLRWADEVGVSRGELVSRVQDPAVGNKVKRHMELAAQLGASGTPAFRINGVTLVGAQPLEKFTELIDQERGATAQLLGQGVPADQVYATRVAENAKLPERADAPSADAKADPADTTVHRVPVGTSPVQGPSDALITMVEFTDYQCPFCRQVQPTVDAVMTRYAGKIRLVRKHNPLPFHDRAVPAALLTLEARAQQGDKGFWAADRRVFGASPPLDDTELLDIARELKLNLPRVKAALTRNAHAAIQQDQDLADDVEARGTPTFFINGRRLGGAQPLERFTALIDEELAKAETRVRAGTPKAKLYAELMSTAPRATLPTKSIPAPPTNAPSRGPRTARIVVQVFSDFQCPFCSRVNPTLDELMKAYPRDVRIVWRNLPLPFHKDAPLAAAAALEAHAQKGDKGFWQMHDTLFANQRREGGLKRDALESYARDMGLNQGRFARALERGTHDAAIARDEAVAKAADIKGTPAIVINGYFVSGAQPLERFKRAVRAAQADLASGKKP